MTKEDGKGPAVVRYKEQIIRYKPDLIVVFLGANDLAYSLMPDLFSKDYDSVIKDFKKELPKSRIVTVGILPGKKTTYDRGSLEKFNMVIQSIALENRVDYVDPQGWLEEDDYLDSIHPNMGGEAKIADKLYTYLVQNDLL